MAPPTAAQLTVALVWVIDDVVNPVGFAQTGAAPIEKLTLDISKKIFPTDCTFTLQVVACVEGTAIISDPSFGVDVARIVGKVLPPSVDSKIFTAAQFTDPAFVPFTLQVTVAVLPAFQVTAVFGAVTAKGPEVLVTVTTASVKAVCPMVDPAT